MIISGNNNNYISTKNKCTILISKTNLSSTSTLSSALDKNSFVTFNNKNTNKIYIYYLNTSPSDKLINDISRTTQIVESNGKIPIELLPYLPNTTFYFELYPNSSKNMYIPTGDAYFVINSPDINYATLSYSINKNGNYISRTYIQLTKEIIESVNNFITTTPINFDSAYTYNIDIN
jgi:hypothetical protein